jgi:hypothetical protein
MSASKLSSFPSSSGLPPLPPASSSTATATAPSSSSSSVSAAGKKNSREIDAFFEEIKNKYEGVGSDSHSFETGRISGGSMSGEYRGRGGSGGVGGFDIIDPTTTNLYITNLPVLTTG